MMAEVNFYTHLALSSLLCLAKENPDKSKIIADTMQNILDMDRKIRESGNYPGNQFDNMTGSINL